MNSFGCTMGCWLKQQQCRVYKWFKFGERKHCPYPGVLERLRLGALAPGRRCQKELGFPSVFYFYPSQVEVLIFKFEFHLILFCFTLLYLCVGPCVPSCMCGGQRQLARFCSFSTVWAPEIEHKLLGLAAGVCTPTLKSCGTSLQCPLTFFSSEILSVWLVSLQLQVSLYSQNMLVTHRFTQKYHGYLSVLYLLRSICVDTGLSRCPSRLLHCILPTLSSFLKAPTFSLYTFLC